MVKVDISVSEQKEDVRDTMGHDFVLFLNLILEKVFCFVLLMKKYILNKHTTNVVL